MKVLLVDDSTLSRKVQAKVLREIGIEDVIEAKNGLDALSTLKELDYQVDIILTDWNMPGMDGMHLIRSVRETHKGKHLPIIVISSEGEEDKIAQALVCGANGYVTKPFKKEILARKIQGVRGIAEIGDGGRPRPGGGDAPSMEGDLERLGFAELVGFLNFSKKTGELVMELPAGEAGVSFVQGDVKDAWIGRTASEDAFFAIARLRQGRFRFHEGRPPRGQRITKQTMSLLMEAMRLLDEESARGSP